MPTTWKVVLVGLWFKVQTEADDRTDVMLQNRTTQNSQHNFVMTRLLVILQQRQT